MRRSIQGVGHMMSTMVLNRKQSVFGAPSLPGGAGAAEPLDRSKFEENEDIVVMETKLKILEILQVAGPGARWEVLGIRQASGGRYSKMGWSGSLRSVSSTGSLCDDRLCSPVVLKVWSSDQQPPLGT